VVGEDEGELRRVGGVRSPTLPEVQGGIAAGGDVLPPVRE